MGLAEEMGKGLGKAGGASIEGVNLGGLGV